MRVGTLDLLRFRRVRANRFIACRRDTFCVPIGRPYRFAISDTPANVVGNT